MKTLSNALLAGFIAIGGAGAASAQQIELKVSHHVPPNHTIHKEFLRWGAELAEKSGGRLKLAIFPASQMGPPPRQLDLVRTGVADVAMVLAGLLPGRTPLTEAMALPFVFNKDDSPKPLSAAQASPIVTGMVGQLEKEYPGSKVLYIVASPAGSLFFGKAVVRMPADLKGLRVRHNGPIPMATLKAWGATPASVAPAEVTDALAKGVIDGTVFNYEGGQAFQLAESARTVTELNFAAGLFVILMNRAKYDSLAPDLRKLIDETTGIAAARRVGAAWDRAEAAGREYFLGKKAEIVVPDAAQHKAFRAAAKPVIDQTLADLEAKGMPAKAFFAALARQVQAAKP